MPHYSLWLHSARHRDLAARWYERLYRLGIVSHWLGENRFFGFYGRGEEGQSTAEDAATRSVLDLQGFSRGMAYAALRSAIEEVRCSRQFSSYNAISVLVCCWTECDRCTRASMW